MNRNNVLPEGFEPSPNSLRVSHAALTPEKHLSAGKVTTYVPSYWIAFPLTGQTG